MGSSSQPTVLIVEDEWLVREITAEEFRDRGFAVIEAGDGQTALAALSGSARIDLLFTDIRLIGGLDGWSVARAARDARPGIPVIYATGYTAEKIEMVEGGRFFKKPYRPAAIIAAAAELGIAAADAPGP